MRPVAIIQVRVQSTRLPGKVLMPLCGQPMLAHIVQRVRIVPELADVVVATSTNPADVPIRDWCYSHGVPCVAGDEQDVLSRYVQAALEYRADPVIRCLGDCPLVDPVLIRRVLALWHDSWHDLVGVATGAGALHETKPRWPDGVDVECVSFAALSVADLWSSTMEREHVTPYLWTKPERFSIGRVYADVELGHHRWTVDHEADYRFVKDIYQALWRKDKLFTTDDVLAWLAEHPEALMRNRQHVGQEGYEQLWQK